MGGINFGRVLLGGIVAGLVMNVSEFVFNTFLLANQLKEFLARHNFPQPAGGSIGVAVAMTFVLGIVMILGYAAIRPRFGAGPKTAIITALFTWFGVTAFHSILDTAFGLIAVNTLAIVLAWHLVENVIAALIGAALYKET